ncbi:MAG: hypothetical protein V4481_04540 [Patescibacteria group bacterium]
MSLDQKDLELIERLIYKNADDVAVSIARSFERLEERIDTMEGRLYTRISEVEDRMESSRQDLSDSIGNVKDEFRDWVRLKEGGGELD